MRTLFILLVWLIPNLALACEAGKTCPKPGATAEEKRKFDEQYHKHEKPEPKPQPPKK